MDSVVHFGAGNIGRGFIGNVLSQAGYRVIFADVNDAVISALRDRGGYTVEEVGRERRTVSIEPVTGLNSGDDALLDRIAETSLVTTAVGPRILPIIAKTLAPALERRRAAGNDAPLNVIACENMIGGSAALRDAVLPLLSAETREYVEATVGFPNSAVDRIVPPTAESEDPLAVRVEEFSEWIVDRLGFVGAIPDVAGMQLTDRLDAFVERKLFTLNTGHAVTAYHGTLAGYETIQEAIADSDVRRSVRGAMEESGNVLIQRYGFKPPVHAAYIDKIIGRFENPYLRDELKRVGREPLRKLSYNDRLIKPLRGTLAFDLPRTHLIAGIVAALRYRNADDPQAEQLQSDLRRDGVEAVLRGATGLGAETGEDALIEEIVAAYTRTVEAAAS